MIKKNKKTFGSLSKNSGEKKKRRKTTRMAIAKLFALHSNAKKDVVLVSKLSFLSIVV